MPRTTRITYSEGIFHGLPTFPEHDGRKYTAIVTGANGISGSEIVNALAASPERWETIYALSRRPPPSAQSYVKPIAADFLETSTEDLAALFQREGIKADYVFFASYLQPPTKEGAGVWSNVDDLERVNVTLLSNFLKALTIANITPKRITLQTGGKHYALHLGPATIPMTEDTPADRIPHDNFYFPQEDLLSSWAAANQSTWTVTRPGFILGANSSSPINISYPLAIYASVQRELGARLEYPSDTGSWDINKDLSTASLIGYFSEWAALTPAAAGEAFNIVDDSPFSYGKFWPQLAGWYGIPFGTPEVDEERFAVVTMQRSPPPRGFGSPGKVNIGFSFEAWAAKPEVREAWERIQEREGLDKGLDPWRDRSALQNVFGTLDGELLGNWARTQTMDKAKKMGWTGHVQTDEGFKDTLDKMIALKMVPPL